ncbi:hypothetical protein EBZ39_07480 [bacterium]|nr:hypothetical protein [bacterium]
MILRSALLILSLAPVVLAEPKPEHAAPALASPQAAAQPTPPAGLTKNMAYLPEAMVTGFLEDKTVMVLEHDNKQYLVMDFPAMDVAVGETLTAIVVRGKVVERLGNRRVYNWFSDGQVTPELIRAYPSRKYAAASPLE